MSAIRLRPVTREDAARLLAWHNDPETRGNSLSVTEVTPEEHAQWLEAKIGLPLARIAIGELDGQAFGMFRADPTDDGESVLLSLVIAPEWRGRGLARQFVAMGLEQQGEVTALAEMRLSNVRSRAVFERLGFRQIDAQGDLLLYAKELPPPAA